MEGMDAPRSSRREFLSGRSAVDALTASVDAALGPGEAWEHSPLAEVEPRSYLVQFSRRAMACQFEVLLNAGQYPQGTESALAALDLVEQLEDQLSVFREQSELSRINREAALAPLPIEPRLFALLQLAQRLHRETHGAYDLTSTPLWEIWGFKRREGRLPTDEEIATALMQVGMDRVLLDPTSTSVRFSTPGVRLNLGSIGKGYALDRCQELLTAAGMHDFCIHGGNSSLLARGQEAGSATPGWTVGLRSPLHPDRSAGTLRLVDRALATSGSLAQFFIHKGKRFGHILDPRTGWPAEGVLSATVLAPSAALADALSTAFYVLGREGTERYCAADASVGVILQTPGKREGEVNVELINVDASVWSPA
jgi:thiamine biosynthesis lipoprotein